MDIKELVKDRTVKFQYYRDGNLIYNVVGTNVSFHVPISDIGNATFLCEDRAILFMRYIRKHLEQLSHLSS